MLSHSSLCPAWPPPHPYPPANFTDSLVTKTRIPSVSSIGCELPGVSDFSASTWIAVQAPAHFPAVSLF